MKEQYTSEEILREWLDNRICVRSQYRRISYRNERAADPLKVQLDEISGWNEFVRFYVQRESEALRTAKGLFLTGPSGTGKHTAAAAAAMYLADRKGWFEYYGDETSEKDGPFEILYVSASDLSSQETAPEEYMDYLLDNYLNYGSGGVCLILEYPEALPEYRRFLEELGYLLISYRNRRETNLLFFFILSENLEEDAIPAILRSQIQVCRMQPPNTARREAFWRRAAKTDANVRDWMDDRTPEEMAEQTEGMTYRQLSDMIRSIFWAVEAGNNEIAEEHFFCEQQTVLPQTPQPDEKEILYRKIGNLLEEIPELAGQFIDAVRHISVSAGGSRPVVSERAEPAEEQRTPGLIGLMGENGRFLKEGIDENTLMKGVGLEEAFDRESFREDIANRRPDEILPEIPQ